LGGRNQMSIGGEQVKVWVHVTASLQHSVRTARGKRRIIRPKQACRMHECRATTRH
jgi:hypothetical protein